MAGDKFVISHPTPNEHKLSQRRSFSSPMPVRTSNYRDLHKPPTPGNTMTTFETLPLVDMRQLPPHRMESCSIDYNISQTNALQAIGVRRTSTTAPYHHSAIHGQDNAGARPPSSNEDCPNPVVALPNGSPRTPTRPSFGTERKYHRSSAPVSPSNRGYICPPSIDYPSPPRYSGTFQPLPQRASCQSTHFESDDFAIEVPKPDPASNRRLQGTGLEEQYKDRRSLSPGSEGIHYPRIRRKAVQRYLPAPFSSESHIETTRREAGIADMQLYSSQNMPHDSESASFRTTPVAASVLHNRNDINTNATESNDTGSINITYGSVKHWALFAVCGIVVYAAISSIRHFFMILFSPLSIMLRVLAGGR